MEEKDTIHISGKAIGVIVILLLLLVGTFGMFFLEWASGSSVASNSATDSKYSNIPEKCRPPFRQDIESWKQHLSHHQENQDCLKYFN